MPRPLIFSNGSFLIGVDSRYRIRDLFYPQIGRWNHLSGHPIRMGVWVEGKFSWVYEKEWEIGLGYQAGTLSARATLVHPSLRLRIETEEGMSHQENWFARCLTVHNLSSRDREVRIFFSHDLRIMESDIGDTAFFHPGMGGVVHYKDGCYFLFGGKTPLEGIYQYATGMKAFKGFEGTWRDAEDGELSMNPIAQGSVDSTISFRMTIEANKSAEMHYWIAAADDLERLQASHRSLLNVGCEKVLSTNKEHWRKWADAARDKTIGLPDHLRELCAQSLLMMRTHIDNGGAIIAATDSDIMETNRANYCYMWPRDGALVSSVLDEAGQHHLPRAFFEFCNNVLPKDPPVLRQKYTADGKLGATWHPWIENGRPHVPFQEDETALMILAIWKHHQAFPDLEALRQHFEKFVRPAADFMAGYRNAVTNLPAPSYDIWEERLGVHTFTVATVIAGLEAASKIAAELKEDDDAWQAAVSSFRRGLNRLADPKSGVFLRRLVVDGHKLTPDWVVDASTLNVGLLGVLPIDDPRVRATADMVERKLWVKGLGGLARYDGDYYFRRHEQLPGNPWIICTCWLAQHKIKAANSLEDLTPALELMEWVYARASSTWVLPEQVDAVTGEALSVSPLTWSHAEFVRTCFDYAGRAEGLKTDG